MGSFTTIYKLSMTLLEVIRQNSDPMNQVISEAVAGFSSFILLGRGNGSPLLLAYAMIKAIMFLLNSKAFKKLKDIKAKRYIIYAVSLIFICFCLIRDN